MTEIEILRKFYEAIANIPKEVIANYDKVLYMREKVKECNEELKKL